MSAPHLSLPEERTPESLLDVICFLVSRFRKEYFANASDREAAFPGRHTIEEAGYSDDSDFLWRLLQELGVVVPTGKRNGRGGSQLLLRHHRCRGQEAHARPHQPCPGRTRQAVDAEPRDPASPAQGRVGSARPGTRSGTYGGSTAEHPLTGEAAQRHLDLLTAMDAANGALQAKVEALEGSLATAREELGSSLARITELEQQLATSQQMNPALRQLQTAVDDLGPKYGISV